MMKENQYIYLPGMEHQFRHIKNKINIAGTHILIIGANSETVAEMFSSSGAGSVKIIIDNYDSLLKTRYMLRNKKEFPVRLMEYNKTDFHDSAFDLVYAQAAISNPERHKIINEINRILSPGGYLCTGEITLLKNPAPEFVKEIWKSGNIQPLTLEELIPFYEDKHFTVIDSLDLSDTLKGFYLASKKILDDKQNSLSEKEKSFHKKLLNRMSHESNVYLKLGGKDYMGFTSLIARKAN